ncbi:MAG: ProQ/FINO family protein [Comamonas sp.]|nr:ProQ/FINO family protein [Comamonas sp.]
MHDMTSDFLEAHVTQREYLEGILYFKKRFDLEGAVVEDISPQHLKSAQNRLAKLTGTEVS